MSLSTHDPRGGHFEKDCLYSIVKNTSGGQMTFSFLPPHGAVLEADEEYSMFGSLVERIGRGDTALNTRYYLALSNAIDAGDLTIMQLPSPILLDTSTQLPKMLQSASGTVTGVAPCWETSESLEAGIGPWETVSEGKEVEIPVL